MKALFYEVVREAQNGKVIIDKEEWGISFNTIIYDNGVQKYEYFNDKNLSNLVIKNEEEFIEVLEEYIYYSFSMNRKTAKFLDNIEYNKMKMLIAYLFINFSTEDFLNPVSAIRRNIDFMHDKTFNYLDEGYVVQLGEKFGGSDIYL